MFIDSPGHVEVIGLLVVIVCRAVIRNAETGKRLSMMINKSTFSLLKVVGNKDREKELFPENFESSCCVGKI